VDTTQTHKKNNSAIVAYFWLCVYRIVNNLDYGMFWGELSPNNSG